MTGRGGGGWVQGWAAGRETRGRMGVRRGLIPQGVRSASLPLSPPLFPAYPTGDKWSQFSQSAALL